MLRLVVLAAALALTVSSGASAAPPPNPAVVSFTVTNRPLATVLAGLSYEFHTNIIADQSLGTIPVTMTLKNVTLTQAVEAITKAYALQAHVVHGIVVVGKSGGVYGDEVTLPLRYADAASVAKNLQQGAFSQELIALGDTRTNAVLLVGQPEAIDAATRIVRALDIPGSGTLTITTCPLSHISPKAAVTQLRDALPSSDGQFTVTAVQQANAVVLTGAAGTVALAQALLDKLDAAPKRVSIAVRVLDVTPQDDQKDLGVILGGYSPNEGNTNGTQPVANQLFEPFVNRALAVNATINTLLQQGSAKILAAPNTMVESGETGHIQVGDQVPIVTNNGGLVGGVTVTTLNTGMTMDVTPRVGADGTIELAMDIRYAPIDGYSQGYPKLGTRQDATVVPVHDGETLTFGGLVQDVHSKTVIRVPLLGDIPWVGHLFRNVTGSDLHEEVVFQVTPSIVPEGK